MYVLYMYIIVAGAAVAGSNPWAARTGCLCVTRVSLSHFRSGLSLPCVYLSLHVCVSLSHVCVSLTCVSLSHRAH